MLQQYEKIFLHELVQLKARTKTNLITCTYIKIDHLNIICYIALAKFKAHAIFAYPFSVFLFTR